MLNVEEDIVIDESSDVLMEGYTKQDLIDVIKETPLPDKLIAYISRFD
jgi:hypothetical protein